MNSVTMELKKEGDYAYILEFRVHDPEDEATLRDMVEAALLQIEEKQYEAALVARGVTEDKIRKYVLANIGGYSFAPMQFATGGDVMVFLFATVLGSIIKKK